MLTRKDTPACAFPACFGFLVAYVRGGRTIQVLVGRLLIQTVLFVRQEGARVSILPPR